MTTQDAGRKPQAASSHACSDCAGKGWIPAKVKDGWPKKCAVCDGTGKLTPAVLGRFLGVATRDVRRVLKCKPTHRVGLRVLDRILERYPQAFA